jgi:hypothetical protein
LADQNARDECLSAVATTLAFGGRGKSRVGYRRGLHGRSAGTRGTRVSEARARKHMFPATSRDALASTREFELNAQRFVFSIKTKKTASRRSLNIVRIRDLNHPKAWSTRTAIGHKTNAKEAKDHHRPSRGFRNCRHSN